MREARPGDDGFDEHESEPNTIKEIVITIAAAVGLALFVQWAVVKPFRIPSGSMENTLRCEDRVLVDRVSYRFGRPHRADVVVFHPPAGLDEHGNPDPSIVAGEGAMPGRDKEGDRVLTRADVNYIKRIIGMPGDKLEVRDHHAYIDGKRLDEPYLHPLPKAAGITSDADFGPITVPKGTYFMMGDHRDHSQDSRFFRYVPRDFIVGKAFMVYWPPKRFGGLPERDPGGPDASLPDPNCLEGTPIPPDAGDEGNG